MEYSTLHDNLQRFVLTSLAYQVHFAIFVLDLKVIFNFKTILLIVNLKEISAEKIILGLLNKVKQIIAEYVWNTINRFACL